MKDIISYFDRIREIGKENLKLGFPADMVCISITKEQEDILKSHCFLHSPHNFGKTFRNIKLEEYYNVKVVVDQSSPPVEQSVTGYMMVTSISKQVNYGDIRKLKGRTWEDDYISIMTDEV